MLLALSKRLSMRFSNNFVGKKISIEFIVYIILFQSNKNDSNLIVFIQGLL